MAEVRIAGLSKSFGSLRVLDDLDLICPDHAYVCLLGPSGCGKSTLLRTIAGLEAASAGTIHIGSERVEDKLPGERNIGFAFQNYALYPHLNVRGNLSFPLEVPRRRSEYPPERIASRVAETAAMLRITEYLNKPVNALSGGQKQRVALGRALVGEPQVLLLDEPITHLDARLRHEMRAELKLLHQRLGTTTIHVTHDQFEALAIADLVAVMRAGRIEQVGSPDEIYEQPSTAFVASFIGDPPMSLLPGRPSEQGFLCSGVPLAIDDGLRMLAGLHGLEEVLLGVRSTSIKVSTQSKTSIKTRLMAHEWIGREQQLTLEVAGTRLRLRTESADRYHVGEEVWLAIDLSRAIPFDPQTGLAVRDRMVEG